jgi:hypothetical protein
LEPIEVVSLLTEELICCKGAKLFTPASGISPHLKISSGSLLASLSSLEPIEVGSLMTEELICCTGTNLFMPASGISFHLKISSS